MSDPCTFPHRDPIPATTTNRAGQPVCGRHEAVVVTGSGIKNAPKEES